MKKLIAALVLTSLLSKASFAVSISEAIRDAKENYPNYIKETNRVEAANYRYKGAYSTLYPSVDVALNSSKTFAESPNSTTTSSSITLSASLKIFDGTYTYYNIKQKKEELHISEIEFLSALLDLEKNVATSYYAALRDRFIYESYLTMRDNANSTYDYTKAKYEAGGINKTDLLQAQVNFTETVASLADAKANYINSLSTLSKYTGVEYLIEESFEDDFMDIEFDNLSTYVEMAKNGNTSILKAKSNKDVANLGIKTAYSTYYPKVTLDASTGRYYSDENDYNNSRIGVNFTWNAFSGFNNSNNVKSAKENYYYYTHENLAATNEVYTQLKITHSNLVSLKSKLESLNSLLLFTENSYNLTMTLYQEGGATFTEVTSSRDKMEEAIISYNNTKYQIMKNYLELLNLTGEKLNL